ncbi:hypothetical protein [Aneurinibacillus thermoaerophilus]|uniref:hypothetical protein n=1 Tax=Aneurinibacillus thermoaerophilus TaxID=143495 RepID=UPI002E1BDFAD|nr:hypothetical protein [Aneurinibacillus thermoaerophilus]MED0737259.1 hypothetical protein [Aneurinibacillus thermoaerophilus]MED0764879.1 hypothetical protein [Aneurinibacillus thermoaerophilus]
MSTSLRAKKVIMSEELEERLENVQELRKEEYETYVLVKDRTTGEHYVRYTQRHLNIMEGGVEEVFDHLLPVSTDDVLAIVFGEQDYTYPTEWKQKYLRGSNVDPYVWFDPTDLPADPNDDSLGKEIYGMLETFKAKKNFDDQAIAKLFKQIDDMLENKDKK